MKLFYGDDSALHVIIPTTEKDQQKAYLNWLLEQGINEEEPVYYILRMIERKENLQ